jgi:hypothetical protein
MPVVLVSLVVAFDIVMLAAAWWQNLLLLSDDSDVPHRLRVFIVMGTFLLVLTLVTITVCTQALRGESLVSVLPLAVPSLCVSGKITQVLMNLQRKSRIQAAYDRGES